MLFTNTYIWCYLQVGESILLEWNRYEKSIEMSMFFWKIAGELSTGVSPIAFNTVNSRSVLFL